MSKLIRPTGSQLAAEYSTTLYERNVCVAYHNRGGKRAAHRTLAGPPGDRWLQMQQLISLRHTASAFTNKSDAVSVLLGFSEYTLNYMELLVMRESRDRAERERLERTCTRRHAGFALPFSFNNVYHAIFHAVPASEWWAQLLTHKTSPLSVAATDDNAVTFVPILHQRMAVREPSDARRWYAWEVERRRPRFEYCATSLPNLDVRARLLLTCREVIPHARLLCCCATQFALRALTSRSREEIGRQTEQLIGASCTCFDHLYGSSRAFNFNARLGSRPRMQAFRRALLASLGRIPQRAMPQSMPQSIIPHDASLDGGSIGQQHAGTRRMLYVHRHGATRVVTNERALHAALSVAIPHMHRVVLDGMPLHEQMRTVASATSLVAVFGQALTWMILLERGESGASGSARTHGKGKDSGGKERGGNERGGAVLELSPKEAFWKQDYQILAKVLGLRFNRIYGKVTESECIKQPPLRVRWQQRLAEYNRWLTCNLTMDVPVVVKAAREMEGV